MRSAPPSPPITAPGTARHGTVLGTIRYDGTAIWRGALSRGWTSPPSPPPPSPPPPPLLLLLLLSRKERESAREREIDRERERGKERDLYPATRQVARQRTVFSSRCLGSTTGRAVPQPRDIATTVIMITVVSVSYITPPAAAAPRTSTYSGRGSTAQPRLRSGDVGNICALLPAECQNRPLAGAPRRRTYLCVRAEKKFVQILRVKKYHLHRSNSGSTKERCLLPPDLASRYAA